MSSRYLPLLVIIYGNNDYYPVRNKNAEDAYIACTGKDCWV